MKYTDEGLAGSCEKTWEVVAAKQRLRSRIAPHWGIDCQNIPPRVRLQQRTKAEKSTEPETSPTQRGKQLRTPVRILGREPGLVQKIIGRNLVLIGGQVLGSASLSGEDATFTLLHQPAGEHGSRVLFHPLIEQRANFLSQVSREVETREFVALQGIAGGGKKKLPRWLRTVLGQENLQTCLLQGYRYHPSIQNILVTIDRNRTPLWKSVENKGGSMSACSGCAGDYEDPDRSAWEEEPADAEEEVRRRELEQIDWGIDEAGEG